MSLKTLAATLHRESIVIDGCCPLVHPQHLDAHLQGWIDGGVTACVGTVATSENAPTTLGLLAAWMGEFRDRADQIVLATTAADVRRAKVEGKLAVILQFQGTGPIEMDLNWLEIYARLGVSIVQLAYNQRCAVGDGCEEPENAGLSEFGRQVVRDLNRHRMVVDLSHTGRRTTLEAIDLSDRPCVFTHANADRVCPSPRNATDEQIRAVAARGGTIGIVGFPSFVVPNAKPTLDDLIDHADYIANLVGVDHVTIGMDYFHANPPMSLYEKFVELGKWKPTTYPPPPWQYPLGLESPALFPNLTARLLERGFSEADTRKVLGENFLRVFAEVRGA